MFIRETMAGSILLWSFLLVIGIIVILGTACYAGLLSLAVVVSLAVVIARLSSPAYRYKAGERFWLFCFGAALMWFAIGLILFNTASYMLGITSSLHSLKNRDYIIYIFSVLFLPFVVWSSFVALLYIRNRSHPPPTAATN